MNGSLLQARNVTIRFGGLTAVSDFNLDIQPHELIGLIGPNGAGKTTVFNMLTGVYNPTDGEIRVSGVATRELKPFDITALGIARTFQNIRLFSSLSVFDNVRAACNMHLRHGISQALWRGKTFANEEREIE